MSEYLQPCEFCKAVKERIVLIEENLAKQNEILSIKLEKIHDKIDKTTNRLPIWATVLVTILTSLVASCMTFAATKF